MIKLKARERTYNDFGQPLIANFLDVIRRGHAPLVPAHETLNGIAMIEACYRISQRFAMPWYDPSSIDALEPSHAR